MVAILNRLSSRPLVSVIRLEGVIGGSGRFGSAMTDTSLAPLIERAFKGKPQAVALAINSPGGSPTQSALIEARIRRLADEHSIPVYAFCEDVAASGGYWLATAGDEIYVDANSIVGSIGVIYSGFGFPEFLAKHGLERRVYTAGEDKSILDPFRPEKESDVARLMELQKIIHGNFISQVKTRRGDKLAEKDLFTGDIFLGSEAVENGLVDGIAHLVPKMQEIYGEKVRFTVSRQKKGLLKRLGAQATAEIIGSIEDRALWARYGL